MATPESIAFGEALSAVLDGRPTTAASLAVTLRTTKAQVDSWLAGRMRPSPADVFEMERVLDLAPGCLSRELGFLPVGIAGDRAVEDAISSSPAVDADGRQLALGLWCTLVFQCAARRRLQSLHEAAMRGAGPDAGVVGASPTAQRPLPLVVSADEAGRLLNISGPTLKSMIQRGQLPAILVGRRLKIARSDIEAFVEQNRV